MNTTALFAEILVVGLEAEGWIFLLVLAGLGTGWLADLDVLGGWEALFTLLVLATAYVLGVLVDRSADTLFRWSEKKPLKPRVDFPEMRLEVMDRSEGMAKFLDYQRSRLRVARGTLLNLPFLVLGVALFLPLGAHLPAVWIAAPLASGLVLIPLGMFVHKAISHAYDKRLIQAYGIVSRKPDRP